MHMQLHDHSDELVGPGKFKIRDLKKKERDFTKRAFTIGIGGPVGSGKTALVKALCEFLRERYKLAVVTNDIFTKEDAEFLTKNKALEASRIMGVETGGCPHAAIREDISPNLSALRELMKRFDYELDICFVESGGDNLAAHFGSELADYTIYVIDVSGGDKIPRKGGPGITQSDLLVINKIDLAHLIGANLQIMGSDAQKMRGEGPFVFTNLKSGVGHEKVGAFVEKAFNEACSKTFLPSDH